MTARAWQIRPVAKPISAMDLPEHEDQCLHGFWTEHPCENRATWIASEEMSQWRACDRHRMRGDVPRIARSAVDARMRE